MTDEELETFLKPPEVISHEMRPPTIDQKLTHIAKSVKRSGEKFGRETDTYAGGIGGVGGGGAGALISPMSRPLTATTRAGLKAADAQFTLLESVPARVSTDVDHFRPMESRVEVREVDVSDVSCAKTFVRADKGDE